MRKHVENMAKFFTRLFWFFYVLAIGGTAVAVGFVLIRG